MGKQCITREEPKRSAGSAGLGIDAQIFSPKLVSRLDSTAM